MEIGKTQGVRLRAGGMAELHFGILASSLNHVVLMAEAVGEDQLAARVGQLSRRFVALVGLGDVGLKHHLVVGQAKLLLNCLGSVHEVLVVGGVFVVQENEADLEVCGNSGRALFGSGGFLRSSGLFGGSGLFGNRSFLSGRGFSRNGLRLAAGEHHQRHGQHEHNG